MRYDLSLEEIEATNARISANFDGLHESVQPWELRALAKKFAPSLGLSDGATLHLRNMLEVIGEDHWRSPSPLAFRSVIRCAVLGRKSERQITRYEAEIIRAGLAFRPVKHGRRHGEAGGNGLNFAPLCVRLDHFKELADNADQFDARHSKARAAYRSMLRKIKNALERVDSLPCPMKKDEFVSELDALHIKRISAAMSLDILERACDAVAKLLQRVESFFSNVDNQSIHTRESDQSDTLGRHLYPTDNSYPSDTCSKAVEKQSRQRCRVSHPKERANARDCWGKNEGGDRGASQPTKGISQLADSMIHTALTIASSEFIEAYQRAPKAGWGGMIHAAESRARHIEIAPQLWTEVCERMGPEEAALSVIVIEAKLATDEIKTPAAYLRSLGQRAQSGSLHIAKSVFGIARRTEAGI